MRFALLFFVGILGFFALFDYSLSHPQPTSAALIAQLPVQDDLITPVSPTPVWPFIKQLVAASDEAKPHPNPLLKGEGDDGDFCLDVPVIMYHHIQPLAQAQLLGHAQLTVDSSVFERQMKYLVEQGYTAISAEDLVNALKTHETLSEKSIVITIDDGYIDNYSYAFMMAKKYNLIMNFMIPTELIGKTDYMNWDHLKEMAQNPYARIYNHTASHAALGISSKEKIASELNRSAEQFKSQLDMDVKIFTYPYGSNSSMAVELLREHGFIGAYTTMSGRKQCESEIMLLHRDHVGNAPLSEYGL